MWDGKLLTALAAVVEQGGFEKAAQVLHLTQSAVSQRVRLLEDQAGQVLLVRSNPPRPTAGGLRLLRHWRQVALLERELDAELSPDDGGGGPARLAVAVNADSLATWLLPALEQILSEGRLLLELLVEDQDETHRLLQDGRVLGCVSARAEAAQGCTVRYLGTMTYRLMASPEFAARWFPEGLTAAALTRAPAVIFTRKDRLQHQLLEVALGHPPGPLAAHYVPDFRQFAQMVLEGWGYGALPDQQSAGPAAAGRLVDLAPGRLIPVRLHWHAWRLDSALLRDLGRALGRGARLGLAQ